MSTRAGRASTEARPNRRTNSISVVARRSLRWRGFGVSVEVPDRVARALRRLRRHHTPPPNGLVVEAPGTVSIASREDAPSRLKQLTAYAKSFRPDAAADEVASYSWYHTIELPDGTVTRGTYDHRPLVPHYGLPDDLRGKRALDVGSWDGFWAFELERRGAEVTSVDLETFAELDLPPPLHEFASERPPHFSFRTGIDIARRRLGSSLELVSSSIYDLEPDRVGMFDFVHTGDILLHLRDPVLALQHLHSVTSGEALIADCFDPTLDEMGMGSGLTRYQGGWYDVTWWMPALSTLCQMVTDAGFADVEVVNTYRLNYVTGETGYWRAAIRGRA
jgi:tRNA (mo5U34)-methyltransferase